jgi:hypothetical protein
MKKNQIMAAARMWKILLSLVVLMFFCAQGCDKGSSVLPVNGENQEFPEARFLTAQGIGSTETDARRQAMAELSAVFESRVFSQTASLAKSSLGPDNMEAFEKSLESRIQIISSVRLEGAKIGKVWQDKASGIFHALAVLDRKSAGMQWTHDLELLDNRIGAASKALGTTPGKLAKMAALNRIVSLSLERHVIESRLMVVNYPILSEPDLDLGETMSQLAALQSNLRFYVYIAGEHGQRVKSILSQALTQNGNLLTLDRDTADVWVTGQVEVSPVSLDNSNAVFERAKGDVQVTDADSHGVFAEINEAVRKGHLDRNEAINKAVLAISQQLSNGLVRALGLEETHTKEKEQ